MTTTPRTRLDALTNPAPAAKGALLVIGSAAAFATLPILGRLATEAGMRSNTLLQWRFGMATLALVAAGALRVEVSGRTRVALFGSGIVYTTQTAFFFASFARITAGTTSLLLYLAPAFVVLYSMALGRRPNGWQLASIGLALAGLGVILGAPSAADASIVGLGFGAAAGATLAGYMLLGEVTFAGVPPLAIAGHSMMGASFGFIMFDVVGQGHLDLPASARQWWLVAAIVIVPTLVAIPMMFAAIQMIGAAPTAVISTAEPAFTLVLAWLVLSESIRPGQLLGGTLILAASIIAQRAPGVPTTTRFPAGPEPIPVETSGIAGQAATSRTSRGQSKRTPRD